MILIEAASRFETLAQAWATVWRSAETGPLPALTDGTQTLSYGELDRVTTQLADGFSSRGIAQGSAVAVTMERSLDALLVVLAAVRAGLCPCVFEPGLATVELAARLSMIDARWIVHDGAQPSFALPTEKAEEQFTAIPFDTLATDGRGTDEDAVDPATRALLLFTSGSTGRPKAVQLTQFALLNNALGVIEHSNLSSSDRLLHTMPIYHTNGLNNQLFAPLLAGATIVLAGRFRASEMPELLARHRPTIITGVPTTYSRMLDQRFDRECLASLRMARCGSAPITTELHTQVEALLGCELVVSYGLSEATCTSVMNPPGARRIGSIGTVLRGQRVRLREVVGRMTAEAGTEGEICISGPTLMIGYLGAQEESALALSDGWLRTGDLGRFDADGYLYITGRIKDVIIRGGENLSPAQIESAVMADRRVAACCVVRQMHRDLGEVPAAFVVLKPGAQMSEDEARDAVLQRLSRIYIPERVIFVESLPETAVGKIDRKALSASLLPS
jgi:acyl-CoA synthetase (AMP-forming)/AMP-acid ligase II